MAVGPGHYACNIPGIVRLIRDFAFDESLANLGGANIVCAAMVFTDEKFNKDRVYMQYLQVMKDMWVLERQSFFENDFMPRMTADWLLVPDREDFFQVCALCHGASEIFCSPEEVPDPDEWRERICDPCAARNERHEAWIKKPAIKYVPSAPNLQWKMNLGVERDRSIQKLEPHKDQLAQTWAWWRDDQPKYNPAVHAQLVARIAQELEDEEPKSEPEEDWGSRQSAAGFLVRDQVKPWKIF